MIIRQGEISQLKFRLEDTISKFLHLSLFQSWLDGNWFGLCQQLVASKYFHLRSEGVQGEYCQREQWLNLLISRQSMFSTSWLLYMLSMKVRLSDKLTIPPSLVLGELFYQQSTHVTFLCAMRLVEIVSFITTIVTSFLSGLSLTPWTSMSASSGWDHPVIMMNR